MEESLEVLWQRFKLTADEECEMALGDPVDGLMQKRSDLSLVGNILSDRPQSFEVFQGYYI